MIFVFPFSYIAPFAIITLLAQKSSPGSVDTDIIDIVRIIKTSYAFPLAIIVEIIASRGGIRDVEHNYTPKRPAVTVTVSGYAFFSRNRQDYLYQCQKDHHGYSDQDMVPDSRTLNVFHLYSPYLETSYRSFPILHCMKEKVVCHVP
jgi:hypothetical protein